MDYPRFIPAKDAITLRTRVNRYFNDKRQFLSINGENDLRGGRVPESKRQLSFLDFVKEDKSLYVCHTINEFLDTVAYAITNGDLYLFGGILRDLALFGKRGFNSDIDLVVDGDWGIIVPRLENLGATKNKFGGMRLFFDDIPVDIWLANETWAVREGYINYKKIDSLLQTTVLNWDAILMNWRTKSFICEKNYFNNLNKRYMDIVLENNPNPLGMLVRILRHIRLKDAHKLSEKIVEYIRKSIRKHTYEEIRRYELSSYGIPLINENMYAIFRDLETNNFNCESDRIVGEMKNFAQHLF